MVVAEGRLVPPVGDVLLRSGVEALLDVLPVRKVFLEDNGHQEVHVAVPVPLRALGQGRLRGVELDVHPGPIRIVSHRVDPPGLEVVLLQDEDGVREEHVDERGVVDEVPVRLGHAAQLLDGTAHVDAAAVPAERFEGSDVGVNEPVEGLGVQHPDVVGLEEGVDHELPVHLLLEHPGLVEGVPAEVERREIPLRPLERRVDGEFGAGARHRPHEPVLLDHRNRGKAVARRIHPRKALVVRDPEQLPVRAVCPAMVGTDEAPPVAAPLRDP